MVDDGPLMTEIMRRHDGSIRHALESGVETRIQGGRYFARHPRVLGEHAEDLIQLLVGESPSELVVPAEAVIRTGRRAVVYLAEQPGRYRPVEVEIGEVEAVEHHHPCRTRLLESHDEARE